MLDWIPACDGFAIVACRDAGMTKIHGCFWHMHPKVKCLDARVPKSNTGFWAPKLQRNAVRDAANVRELRALHWRVLIVWDCETKNAGQLAAKLLKFLH